MGYGVVDDLLSSVSRMELGMDNTIEITMISRIQIEKNPRNDRSISGIEELAQDIKMCGLEQPLVVYQKDDGSYRLLTGERRITAIDMLVEWGELPCPEECYLPCIIKDLDEYNLPLNDELKEKYAIQRTNRFNRNPTDADIMKDYKEWKAIITALKAEGYEEFVVGKDGEDREIVQPLKGRTREIAQRSMAMHVSTGQLAKYDAVEKKAIPEVIDAIEQNRLTIAIAEKVSSLDPGEQTDFIDSTRKLKKISKQDYNIYAKAKKADAGNMGQNESTTVCKIEMPEQKNHLQNKLKGVADDVEFLSEKIISLQERLEVEIEAREWCASLKTVKCMELYLKDIVEK